MHNNQKNLSPLMLGIITFVVIAGVIILGATGLLSPKKSNAKIMVTPLFYDFGDIKITGGKVDYNVIISNKSNEEVVLGTIKTSCMCTSAFIEGRTFGMHTDFPANIKLGSNKSKSMKIIFDPMAHGPDAVGPIDRTVYITTNSKNAKNLSINFRGNVIR